MMLTVSLLSEKISMLIREGSEITSVDEFGVIQYIANIPYTRLGTNKPSSYKSTCYCMWNEEKLRWETNQ